MIRMQVQGDRRLPVAPRRYGRLLVLLLTILAIALFSWSMRPASSSGAVMRVALDRVPEERVVEFGHADPQLAAVVPLPPAETEGPASRSEPAGRTSTPSARSTASPRVALVRPDRNGILPIDFSLSQGVSSEVGGVGVPKTIASEQGAATGLTIFLIGGSLIEVDRGELVAALGQLGAGEKASRLPPAPASGRLSLDRVRTAGLDLRYDAIQDRLVLKP